MRGSSQPLIGLSTAGFLTNGDETIDPSRPTCSSESPQSLDRYHRQGALPDNALQGAVPEIHAVGCLVASRKSWLPRLAGPGLAWVGKSGCAP
jgi:hypothetical protein